MATHYKSYMLSEHKLSIKFRIMNYSVLSDYKKTVYAQSNDNKLSVEIRPIRVTRTELVEVSAFQ